MASLVGQQLKNTYDSLLKVDDNGSLGGTYKEITDGLGNGSNLYLGTGGKVGIGTNSPSETLHLAGSSTVKLQISSNSDSGISGIHFGDPSDVNSGRVQYEHTDDAMLFYSNNAERMRIDSSGNVTLKGNDLDLNNGTTLHRITNSNTDLLIRADYGQSSANSTIQFSVDNSEKMRIDSSGNVGIGETNPLHKMEIKSTSDSSDISLKRSQSVLAGGEVLGTIFFSSDDSNLNGSTFPYEIAKIDATSHAGSSGSVGTDLRFFTNLDASTTMTERMRIDNEGNVGIGTAPDSILHAKGASATLTIENTTAGSSGSPNYSGIFFIQSNGTSTGASIQSGDQLNSNSNNDLIFTTRASGGGGHTEKLRILGGGGITFNGDTAQANALDDYEEGTFTPAFNNVTVTYTSQSGKYTKIGRLVQAEYVINVATIDTTDSDVMNLNLPFNAVGNSIILGQVGMGESSLMDSSATPSGFSSSGAGTAINLSNGTTVYRYNNLTNTSGLFYLSIVYTAS